MKTNALRILMASALVGAGLMLPQTARTHCDTLDGPVVRAAKLALEKRDVTSVLKWVKPEAETEVKAAFAKALVVRTGGPDARELADQFFFETVVRVHRAGEGAPFTGLKPASTKLDPAIVGADKALESGDIEPVVKLVTGDVAAGIRQRFAEARQKKEHADQNVATGREFVAAYVEYVHYVEGLHQATQGVSAHPEDAEAKAEPAEHQHHH